jgi:hypothetical protein
VPFKYRVVSISTLQRVKILQPTTRQVPPTYREALPSILFYVTPIRTIHNFALAYTLQRYATEHFPSWTSKSHNPQQALDQSLTVERCRELFTSKSYSYKTKNAIVPISYCGASLKYLYMLQASTGLVVISYIGALQRILLHVSLTSISHNEYK